MDQTVGWAVNARTEVSVTVSVDASVQQVGEDRTVRSLVGVIIYTYILYVYLPCGFSMCSFTSLLYMFFHNPPQQLQCHTTEPPTSDTRYPVCDRKPQRRERGGQSQRWRVDQSGASEKTTTSGQQTSERSTKKRGQGRAGCWWKNLMWATRRLTASFMLKNALKRFYIWIISTDIPQITRMLSENHNHVCNVM